jgi:hypothetical protein
VVVDDRADAGVPVGNAPEELAAFVKADVPRSLAQKLIARAAGRAQVTPGEIVTCRSTWRCSTTAAARAG